jgi:hypothetical protein
MELSAKASSHAKDANPTRDDSAGEHPRLANAIPPALTYITQSRASTDSPPTWFSTAFVCSTLAKLRPKSKRFGLHDAVNEPDDADATFDSTISTRTERR